MAEVHYDTPWEFTCRAPLPKPTISLADALVEDAVKRAPACGVAARRHPHRNGHDGGRVRYSSVATENNRAAAEYDCPWDLKKRPNKQLPVRPCSAIYDRVWEARSGSPTTTTVEQQTDLAVKVNKSVRLSKEEATLTTDRLGQRTAKGASVHDCPSSADRRRLVEAERSPRSSPLVETVFCSKAQPSPPLVETRAEMRNRLIQQVCGGNTAVQVSPMMAPRSKRAGRRPKLSGGVDVVRVSSSNSNKQQQADQQSASPSIERESRSASVVDAQSVETTSTASKQSSSSADDYDVPWEFCNRSKMNRLQMRRENMKTADDEPKLDRKNLSLSFGCAGLNPDSERVDHSLSLERQSWFHGNISRAEAEARLQRAKEGSFLVRMCEKNKEEYALSLKSAKGFMHMKIQLNAEGRWILGYFSQPFDRIPYMIHYYSKNKLPIKGAEHMCLLFPVPDILL